MTDRDGGSAEEAAREAIDPGRVLPGEDLDSRSIADAQSWAATYTELVDKKAHILAALETAMASARELVRDELEKDRAVMLREMERLRRRQRHWQDRLFDLRRRDP